jgi:hypothetical protein
MIPEWRGLDGKDFHPEDILIQRNFEALTRGEEAEEERKAQESPGFNLKKSRAQEKKRRKRIYR